MDFYTHTLYKRIGYVIILKSHVSSRECINSRYRRLTYCFRRFGSICRRYDRSWPLMFLTVGLVSGDRSIDRDRRYAPVSTLHSLVHSTDICARLGLRDSFWVFFSYKKMLGRTETRTRDRMYRCRGLLSVDTNSLRHLPRRSSKNCDLQFANSDRQTD